METLELERIVERAVERGIERAMERRPRPPHVNMTQAAKMLDSRAEALTRLSRRVDVMTLAKISGHKDLRLLQEVYYRESAEDIASRLP